MRLFGRSAASAAPGHSAEPEPCCTVSAVPASVPNAVSPMSPARLLAHSLTSCETRDEWTREYPDNYGFGHIVVYRNEQRDLTITRGYTYGLGIYGGGRCFISTPFTLSKDEKKIVEDALDAFNRRKKDEAEAAALHRLTAQGIEAQRAETVKQGSVRSTKARSRSDAPKGGSTPPPGDSQCKV